VIPHNSVFMKSRPNKISFTTERSHVHVNAYVILFWFKTNDASDCYMVQQNELQFSDTPGYANRKVRRTECICMCICMCVWRGGRRARGGGGGQRERQRDRESKSAARAGASANVRARARRRKVKREKYRVRKNQERERGSERPKNTSLIQRSE